jgi:MoaA/NifB/PqqE/SkfB family radical SAM enzyme
MPKDCCEIILNYNCDLACRFCSQGDFDPSQRAGLRHVLRHIRLAKEQGYRRLGFSGGEALLRRDLPQLAAAARRAGFTAVRLQTNGMRLADQALCRKLAASGLTVCKFTFPGSSPQFHDALTGVPGSFEKSLRGLDNMLTLRLAVGVNLLATKSSCPGLKKTVKFFMDRGVADIVIIYPLYVGNMRRAARELGVSLPRASGPVAAALDFAAAAGLGRGIKVLNMPPCVLPGHEEEASSLYRFNTVVVPPDGPPRDLDEETALLRTRGRVCRTCFFRRRCAGMDRRYLEIFGWDGIKPVDGQPQKKSLKPIPGYLSGLEKCFLEVLRAAGELPTAAVAAAAEKMPLCRGCRDAANLISAGEALLKKGLAARSFRDGKYFWRALNG